MKNLLRDTGVLLIVLGLSMVLASRFFPYLFNLPGDIKVERGNFAFYFPFTSCVLLSLFLSLLLGIFSFLMRR